ncbi:MAG: hypothetical protein U0795_22625 [Pirellulales bacterium]
MSVWSSCRMAASVLTVASCLMLTPWSAGQDKQESSPAKAAAKRQSAVATGDGGGDSAAAATEVLRAKVVITGGDELPNQWLSLFIDDSSKSELSIDPRSIPGLQIDRVTIDNIQPLSPFFYLGDLVVFGKREGNLDVGQAVQKLADLMQNRARQLQEMLTQETQERLNLIQVEMDKLSADTSLIERRLAELVQQSQGNEAAMKALTDLQTAMLSRRTGLIERQARRDVLSKVRERLMDARAQAVAASEAQTDGDQLVEQQLAGLVAIREKQVAAMAAMVEQGKATATNREEALAQLVDAKLQLAKYKADHQHQSPEVARLDQRLTEVMRDLESAEIEIETTDRVTAALREQLDELRKEVERSQLALTEREGLVRQLEDLHRATAELKQTLIRNRRWAVEGTPIRVRPLEGVTGSGDDAKE